MSIAGITSIPAFLPPDRTWANAYSIIEPQIDGNGEHIWPFDPSFPIDVRHLVFDERHLMRSNRHKYFELILGCAGHSVFQVQDRYIEINPGDLFVMGSDLCHRPVRSHPHIAKAIVLYFLPELISAHELDTEGPEYLMPFLVQDSNFPHVIPADTRIPAEVMELLQRIRAELPAASTESRLYVKTYLKMILVLLNKHYSALRATKEAFYRRQKDLERLHPLFEYMNREYSQRISIGKAASLVYMSKSNFVRFFRQATGQSFAAYLRQFRIAKAQNLLAMTDRPIADVGRDVGFCDQSHFGMTFRKLVQMTPLQYRHNRLNSPAGVTTGYLNNRSLTVAAQ